MRIAADTNVLVRAAIRDDPQQAALAIQLLESAETIVLTLPALCEFVWVTTRAYGRGADEVAASLRRLIASPTARVDRPAVEAGLAFLEQGGDFADGVIGFEGRRLGGPVFTSFDRDAVRLIAANGGETHLLAPSAE